MIKPNISVIDIQPGTVFKLETISTPVNLNLKEVKLQFTYKM